ncbi:ABC transporter ATP-binding protein [Sphingomicrobium nitratireducens]|uniref:ATP-binding cassette domain-containing protein n=1 Tax=Sphingomicrobium nitratireducens TaxID=2964666 RepID=UPI00223F9E57|nr:ABC transporter ATP-binding protein [Sphingomicrobium nitratireducens]
MKDVRELLADFLARTRAAPLLFALLLAGALVEGLGILLLVPLVALAAGEAPPPTWMPFAPKFFDAPERALFVAAFFFLAAMGLRSAILYARDRLRVRAVTAYEQGLKLRLLSGVAAQGWRLASRLGQARLQRRMLVDTPRAIVALHYALQAAVVAVMIAVQGLVALYLSPALTLVAGGLMLVGILLAWPWVRAGQRRGLSLGEAAADSSEEGFRLYASLKSALAEGAVLRFLDRYAASAKRLAGEEIALEAGRAGARAIMALVAATAAVVLILAGLLWLDLDLAILVPLLVLFARLSGPAQQLVQALQGMAAFGPAFAPIAAQAGSAVPSATRSVPPRDWSRLDFDRVTHEADDGFTLGPLDLSLARGEWVALEGVSGAGKTMLVDLVAGLIAPDGGTIRLDGEPIDLATLDGWREGLAYAGQDEVLFAASLADNLGGDPGKAAAVTGLEALLQRLPDGLGTMLGEGGARLSGGERQRVAIARALLRHPRLLILDEATSALDLAAEKQMLDRLRAYAPDLSVLFVSHRPQARALADRVVALQRGRTELG